MKEKPKKRFAFKNRKRLFIKKYLRTGLIIFLAATMVGIASFIYVTERYLKYTEQKYPVYSYTNKSNIQHEVFLIPNKIYSEKSLKEGNIYIASLIDYIDIAFKYEYNGDRTGEVQGKYNVTAVLEGYIAGEKGNKTLWKKEYVLKPETSFNGNGKVFFEECKTPININSYNDYVKMAIDNLNFNFKSKLTITWDVATEIKTDKGIVKERLNPMIEIPLNEKYFEIKGELSQEKKGTMEETKEIISPNYNKTIITCCIGEGFSAVLLLFLLIFTAPSAMPSSLQKKLKKVFKEHGSRLVAVSGEITDTSKKIIEVLSIGDLVKIADDVGRPILYKNSDNLEEISYFYVVDEGNIYMLDIKKDLPNSLSDDKVEFNSINL